MLVEIFSLSFAFASLFISLFTFLHQRKISKPDISLSNVANYNELNSKVFALKYIKNDCSLYLLSKFNIENFSPTSGVFYNCKLKYGWKKHISALTKEEIETSPVELQKIIVNFVQSKETLFNKKLSLEPFSENTVVVIFKLNAVLANFNKRLKISGNYLTSIKNTINLNFKLYSHNLIDNYPMQQIRKAILSKELVEWSIEMKELQAKQNQSHIEKHKKQD